MPTDLIQRIVELKRLQTLTGYPPVKVPSNAVLQLYERLTVGKIFQKI